MEGLIIIDKPKGYTSHDIVNIVRKELDIKKVGHTGTLDPNATGVLPILIGEATKISKYLVEHNKTYIATIKLGTKMSTGDEEGEVLQERKIPKLEEEHIYNVLQGFKGKQIQTPPIYSAIKINGKKAYEYARNGQKVEIKPREIFINNIELLSAEKDRLVVKVNCSKGTYIRTLCEKIAENLGTVGYMQELRRIKVNEYKIEQAITIENLKENKNSVIKNIISIEEVFRLNPKIELTTKGLELFLNGVQLTYKLQDEVYRVYSNGKFIGLGTVKNELLKRDVIIKEYL